VSIDGCLLILAWCYLP